MDELTAENVLAQAQQLVESMTVIQAQNGAGAQMPEEPEQPADSLTLARWKERTFTLEQFLQRPPKQWLVQDVLGVGDLCMLYGEPGSAKTFVALDLAFALATGSTFANKFSVDTPHSVAYFCGEGVGGLPGRLRAVSGRYGQTELPIYLFPDALQLFARADELGVLAFVSAWQSMADEGRVPAALDVVIVDTLHSASAGAEENSAKDAGIITQGLRILREHLGCASVLVHHANKNGDSERGSTAFRGAMDTLLRTQKVGKSFALKCEKAKDFEQWPAQAFALEPGADSVYVAWTGDAVAGAGTRSHTLSQRIGEFLSEHAGEEYTASEVALGVEANPNSTSILNALKDMRQAGSVWSKKQTRKAGAVEREIAVYWVPK